MEQEIILAFDASKAIEQCTRLSKALRLSFPEGIPHDLIRNLPRLLSDVVLGDGGTTVGTDGIRKRLIALRLGDGFNYVMTALRAGKILDLAHAANTSTLDCLHFGNMPE
jgi:hypothetical protein